MGRHTIINPSTGRRIFKTGQLAQSILNKKKSTPAKTTKKVNSSYHGVGATKKTSPLLKKAQSGGSRPSARAMFDMGNTKPVYYGGEKHIMAFRANGSPYYKKVTCKDDV